jgi:hypothetical protein
VAKGAVVAVVVVVAAAAAVETVERCLEEGRVGCKALLG